MPIADSNTATVTINVTIIRKADYYFVTQSGKLYVAAPPKKGEKSRSMKELWVDAKRPIVAVIEDARNVRSLAFSSKNSLLAVGLTNINF